MEHRFARRFFLLPFLLLCCVALRAETFITITLKGDTAMTSEVFRFTDPGFEAKDSVNNDYSQYVTVNGTVGNTLGTYYLVYSIPAGIGKADPKVRSVTLVDETKPAIHLVGLSNVWLNLGQIYTDSGMTLTDNYYPSSSLLARLVTVTNMPVNSAGKYYMKARTCYYMKFITSDPSGNISDTASRNICAVSASVFEPGMPDPLQVFPNPTSSFLHVQSSDPSQELESVTIYDGMGQPVFTARIPQRQGYLDCDVSFLRSGTYIIEMNTTKGRYRKVILVQ
jgi:hypothetical protein